MTASVQRKHRRSAWAVGLLVLLGLGWAVWTMLTSPPRSGRAGNAATNAPSFEPGPLAAKLVPQQPASANLPPGRRVRGIVRLPAGGPAEGARVSLWRVRTAWPEWQRDSIDLPAITGQDGAFVFTLQDDRDVLIEFEHTAFAGGLEELSPHRDEVELRLQRGFELGGLVTNEQGVPLGSVRVSVESVLTDQRRARTETTTSLGGYRFKNLPAGPVRLVARHGQWQPKIESALVGEASHVDLRFDRPAMGPLRGRVVSAAGQSPITGAFIEVMARGGRLGLVAPASERSDAGGQFTLPGLPRGPLVALIRHPEYGAVLRAVTIGPSPTQVTFEMPPRSAVSGRLVADDGDRPEWAGLVVQIRDGAGELDRAVVDAEGRFAFGKTLSPGNGAIVTVVGGALAFQRSLAMNLGVRIEEAERTVLELSVKLPTLVRGKVVDERGQPLRGVTIQQTKLLAENARGITAAVASFDFGSFGSQVAQLVSHDRDQLLTASLADGTFAFRGQQPGPLVVRFDLPGRGSRWLRIDVVADSAGADLGSIALGRGCTIQGRVMRGDRALAGASVTVVGVESQSAVVTREDGVFVVGDLQPGEYRVRARLPSMPTSDVERTVTVTSGVPLPDVSLVMQPGRIVRGAVLGSDGQPVAGALVAVRGTSGQPTLTDTNGAFALELPERAVELYVSLGELSRGKVVPVRPGEDVLPAVSIETPLVSTLTARVVGLPGKKRLPGGLLRLSPAGSGSDAIVHTRWVEMQNGELRWPLCPTGRVRVQIWCDGYAPFDREVDFVANEELRLGDVLLEPGSRLLGRVVDSNGAAVPNASVLLGEEQDLDLFEPMVRSGPDGTFRIGGVTSRSSTLVVRAAGLAPRLATLRLPQDVLAAGPFVVTLEPGCTIEVVVAPGNSEGGVVQLWQKGHVLATCELDENGRAEFTHRGAGSYEVQRFGSEAAGKPVVVEGSGKVVRVNL